MASMVDILSISFDDGPASAPSPDDAEPFWFCPFVVVDWDRDAAVTVLLTCDRGARGESLRGSGLARAVTSDDADGSSTSFPSFLVCINRWT